MRRRRALRLFAILEVARSAVHGAAASCISSPDATRPRIRRPTYNIKQALISIGSGGWFGQGYGHGTQVQLRFLKVRHTDFIFSAIANEFGFVGAVVVILLLAFVIYRIFRAGAAGARPVRQLICYGVGAMLMFPGVLQRRHEHEPAAGHRPAAAVRQLRRQLAVTFLFGIGLVESVILRHKQIEF